MPGDDNSSAVVLLEPESAAAVACRRLPCRSSACLSSENSGGGSGCEGRLEAHLLRALCVLDHSLWVASHHASGGLAECAEKLTDWWSGCWRDVSIHAQEVVGVVVGLDPLEPLVVAPVGGGGPGGVV